MRLVVISKGAFVQISNWLETGWQLLRQAHDRDCLLPSPTDGVRGCRRKELKYTMGSAVQFRLLSSLNVNGKQLFSHSWRNLLPSAAAALVYPKTNRDLLGGWSAKASDRYTRLARQRITAMQLAVAKTFTDRWNLDPLADSETLDCFQAFMSEVVSPRNQLQSRWDSSPRDSSQLYRESKAQLCSLWSRPAQTSLGWRIPSFKSLRMSGQTNVESRRTRGSDCWETIRERSAQRRELPFSLVTMCLSPRRATRLFYIGSRRASE